MNRNLKQKNKGAAFKLALLTFVIIGLSLGGCSENLPTQADEGNGDPVTSIFRVDGIDNKVDFEFMSSQGEDPTDPSEGPFAIRGRNIRYNDENGLLIVDLTVVNMGEDSYEEGVTLTFLSLLPAGVTIHNTDNDEHGNGAAINFEFANDDGQWTPGEESLPRETHFVVEAGTSIGFVARLDTGTGKMMGSIGGMVWNDANGDGIMDEGEMGLEGAMLQLSAEGMETMDMLSSADGTYSFDDLASGFYTVVKKATEGSMPTTPGRIFVVLAAEDGGVTSFMAANFGCKADSSGGAMGIIKGLAWNDLNGDGKINEGEPGLAGLTVELSGDAMATATTDSNGTFTFMDLAMGSYSVSNAGPEGWVTTTSDQFEVILTSDDAVFNEVAFGWMEESTGTPTGIVKGMIWNDINGDGKKTEDEPGLAGAVLALIGDATGATNSDNDGVFMFTDLAAGAYTVISTGPLGWMPTTDIKIDFVLVGDDAVFNEAMFGWQVIPPTK